MNILGIDWGEKKVGLARASSFLAEPWKVIRYESIGVLTGKIEKIVQGEKIEKIVVGVSENESGKKAREFGEKLRQDLKIKIEFEDETLSTYDAQKLSRKKDLEDAYAASIMLQSYLEKHVY